MIKIICLISLLGLSACSFRVDIDDLKHIEKQCAEKGGISIIRVGGVDRFYTFECKANGKFSYDPTNK